MAGPRCLLIAGPDMIESESHALAMAQALAGIMRDRGVPWIFKASFDKANRTSVDSPRGPGLDEGLRVLAKIKSELGVRVTTDFHAPEQAARSPRSSTCFRFPLSFAGRPTC